MQDLCGFGLLWPKISLCFDLLFKIDVYQVVFFDFELAFDRIDKEGQLAAALRVLLGGALHLAQRQPHAHLRQKLARLLEPDVVGLLNHNLPSSAALRYGPVL